MCSVCLASYVRLAVLQILAGGLEVLGPGLHWRISTDANANVSGLAGQHPSV